MKILFCISTIIWLWHRSFFRVCLNIGRKCKLITILILSFFLSQHVKSQTLTYRTLSIENGLPGNELHCAMQDSKGYIWFATQNGACRWDSKNFQYFTIENGLPTNEVIYIYEDTKGRVWFSCFNNELSYYYEGNIYNRNNDSFLRKIEIVPGSKLIEANHELYFVSADRKLSRYNYDTHKIYSSSSNSHLYRFYLINYKNKVWAIDHDNINVNRFVSMDDTVSVNAFFQPNYPNTEIISKIDYKNKKYYFQNGLDTPFYSSAYTSDDFRWAVYNNGDFLEMYKKSLFFKKSKHTINVAYSGFPSLFLMNKMFFFSATNNVLFCQQVPVLEYNGEADAEKSFKYLFKYDNKIYTIDARFRITDIRTHKVINQVKNVASKIYSFQKFNGTYYLITSDAVYYFGNPFSTIYSFRKLGKKTTLKDISKSNRPGYFFSANGSKGAFIINLKKESFKNLIASQDMLVYSIFEDRTSRLWYSSLNKVFYTREYNDTIQHAKEFILDKSTPVFCQHFSEDRHGNIFFVTNNGIYVYDGKLKYKIDKTNLLTDNECKKLLLNPGDNSFWVATNNGLNHIGYTNENGVLRFHVINKFLKADGLYSSNINDILLDSGKLYIATDKGVNALEDVNYQPEKQAISVYIQLSAINGIDYPQGKKKDNLQLKHNQNNLTLTFSALYFLRRDRLKINAFLYRNDELISQNEITEDKIDYYSLNDGDYKLVLRVYDQDYPYTRGNSAPYYFTIYPPYYATWWFIFGVGFLIIIASTGLLFWSLNRQKQRELEQAELKGRLTDSNLKSLQSQMNPHFIFNSLNTIQFFITNKNEEDALNYLSDFSALVREILEQSVNTMIDLESEIQFLKKYIQLEITRFKNSFEVFWDIQLSEDDVLDICIPTMLIQPILENAIKHGIAHLTNVRGEIHVTFKLQQKSMLQITIRNSGNSSMHKVTKGNSIAIQTIKDRLNLYSKNGINGEYSLSVTETGATAIITIPI